jgi:phosphatidylglycerophosphate synthase
LTFLPQLYGLLIFITGLLDGVDGAVARMNDSATPAGGLTDSVVDKIAEMLILTSITIAYPNTIFLGLSVSLWVLLAVFGWIMTSYTRARAEALGITDLDIGLGGRSERLLTLVIFSLLGMIFWGLVIVALMGLCTAAYRLFHYKNQIRKNS